MKLFGTDGIRGRYGIYPITPSSMLQLGWCVGTVCREQHPQLSKILIGRDTRISGHVIESAITSGLLSAGLDVSILGPVPTPAVSYFCRSTDAIAGVVISASHNPAYDNGVKLINSDGSKASDEFQCSIERMMQQPLAISNTVRLGKYSRIEDAVEQYSSYLCSSAETLLHDLRIVVDCANGASYRIAPKVLTALGADVISVGVNPDGYNINHQCGSTNPEFIQQQTIYHAADVGIALDGDGDRVVMVDKQGNLLNGDQLLFVIAMARKRDKRLTGGVVGTLMSNIGLERALSDHGIPFERTEVGDRYISDRLMQLGWNLGGEESGHILNGETGAPGDGIAAVLEVLTEIKNTGRSLHQLVEGIQLVPQVTVNVRLQNRTAPLSQFDLEHWPQVGRALEEAESELNNYGRVLLRASGTEPIIRVLVEGDWDKNIEEIANNVADAVREESHLNA